MKTKYLSIIFLAILTACFSGCINELEFDGEVTKPYLVMNGYVTPDSVVKVHLTKSKFFLQSDETFTFVTNATVKLYVNNSEKEIMTYTSEGYYTSTYKPLVGDIIKIVASNSEFSNVNSTIEVLNPSVILSVDSSNHVYEKTPMISGYSSNGGSVILDTTGYSINEQCDFKVKFRDPADKNNYYRISFKMINYYENDSTSEQIPYFYSDDMVFTNGQEATDIIDISAYSSNYNEFSDELFNGKEYKLKVSYNLHSLYYTDEKYLQYNENPKLPLRRELYITLNSISKAYFLYLKTRAASANEVEFFSEPVQVYSNIMGGLGILGSYSSSTYKFDLK